MTPIWEPSQTWDIHTCTPSCTHDNSHDTCLGAIPNMDIHTCHLAVYMITVMTPIWESSQTWTYIHVHLAVFMITVMTPIWEPSQTWDIHTCTPSCTHDNSHDTCLGAIPNMDIHTCHLAVYMITVMTPIWESSQTWTYIHVHLAVFMITVMTPIWEPSQTWDIHTCTPSCIHDNSHDTYLGTIPNMGHTYMYT